MIGGPDGGVAETIPGDPYQLHVLATQLETLTGGLQSAGVELTAIEATDWQGPAGDAFRSVVHQQPDRYLAAAGAFATASSAIATYAQALTAAQEAAQHAQYLAEQGQVATRNWRSQAALNHRTPAGTDPGAADTELAARTLADAKTILSEAASGLVRALRDAESGAPKAPGLFERIVGDAWGAVTTPFRFALNVDIGFAKGSWGMVRGMENLGRVWAAETDPVYRLIDPSGWRQATDEVNGLGSAVSNHPGEFFKDFGENLVDWNQWATNPGQALGELLPGVALIALTSGAGSIAEGMGDAGDTATDGARSLEELSATLGASGESTANAARIITELNTAVEEQLPAGGLRTLTTLSDLISEASLSDSAAAQLAEAANSATEAKLLRETAEALEQAKAPLDAMRENLQRLNLLNTASSGANGVLGTGQQVNGTGGSIGGQHLVDGEAASLPVEKAVSKIAKPSEVHASGSEGDVHISIGDG